MSETQQSLRPGPAVPHSVAVAELRILVAWWRHAWLECVLAVGAISAVLVVIVYLGLSYRRVVLDAAKTLLHRDRCKTAALRRKNAPRCTSMSVNMEGGGAERNAPRLQRSRSLECHVDGVYLSGVYAASSTVSVMASRRSEPLLSEAKSPRAVFAFQRLPVDCQLRVFGMLSARDRGVAAGVCRDWACLMRSRSMWHDVDLTPVPVSDMRYALYRTRAKLFLAYLQAVRPAVRKLAFAYDIMDAADDGWLPCLESFLQTARCDELRVAHLNWAETPAAAVGESATWTSADYKDLQYRHRRRQRRFVNFFNAFVKAAPNVRSLRLPFDWSLSTLAALERLPRLETLVLEKYFAVQFLEPACLSRLLAGAPQLTRLQLNVTIPSSTGNLAYDVHHQGLEHLDLSGCRGVRLRSVTLPRLLSVCLSRHAPCYLPYVPPMVDHATHCVYDVLRLGAPRLRRINGLALAVDWQEVADEGLHAVLCEVCPGHPHT